MKTKRSTRDWETADAVLLLDAPWKEEPDLVETSRWAYSYGLFMAVPAALIIAGFLYLAHMTPALSAFSELPILPR